MGLFKKKPSVDPAEVAALRSELAELRSTFSRIDASASARVTAAKMDAAVNTEQLTALQTRLESTTTRLGDIDQLQSRIEAAESATTRLGELDQLSALPAQVAALSDQVTQSAADAAAARELAASLESRVAQVSTELTNQLAELGQEMDSLAARPAAPATPPAPTSEVVVEQLREGQVRLANEQARYEIAFREDLATLAEQVRLLRGR